MRAFKYFRGFSGEHPRAWLLSIVRNVGYSVLRKKAQTEPVGEFDEEREPAPSSWSNEARPETPEGALLRAVDWADVQRALETLPAEYREVVVLCDLQEMSYEEAASVLRCAIGTVRSRLHRGRSLLMDKLREFRKPGKNAAVARKVKLLGNK